MILLPLLWLYIGHSCGISGHEEEDMSTSSFQPLDLSLQEVSLLAFQRVMNPHAYLENFTGSPLDVTINGANSILPTSTIFNPDLKLVYPGNRLVINDEGLYRIVGYYGLAFIVRPFTDQLRRQGNNYTIPNFQDHPPLAVYFVISNVTENTSGGLDDGSINHAGTMKTRSITYKNDMVMGINFIGPTMFSIQTHETDIPITLNMSDGPLINVITITGRSNDSAFHASYLVSIQETGDMGIEVISYHSTGPITIQADIYERMTFFIRTSEERMWKIHVQAH